MTADRDDLNEQTGASPFSRDEEGVEVAGHLALAQRALARRRAAAGPVAPEPLLEDDSSLLLQP